MKNPCHYCGKDRSQYPRVIIGVSKGTASVQYAAPGTTIVIRDYDTDGANPDEVEIQHDGDGTPFVETRRTF